MYNTRRRIPGTIGFTGYFLYFVVSLNHQISGEKPVPRDAKDIQFAELKDMIAQLNTTIAALCGARCYAEIQPASLAFTNTSNC